MSLNLKPRRKVTCQRHPNLPTTTGLCGPCLQDRLSLLSPSTSSAADAAPPPPQLRRCMTFSSENRGGGAAVEPRRRSCEVRGRKSLSSLFRIDNGDDSGESVVVESRNLGLTCPEIRDDFARVSDFGGVGLGKLGLTCPVLELGEEDDDDDEEIVPNAGIEIGRVSNCAIESRKLGFSCRVSEFRKDEGEDDESVPKGRTENARVSSKNNGGVNCNVESRRLGLTCRVPEIRDEDEEDDDVSVWKGRTELARVSNSSMIESRKLGLSYRVPEDDENFPGAEIARVSNCRNNEGLDLKNLGLTCRVPKHRDEEEEDDDDDESVPKARIQIARVSNFRNDGESEFDLEQGKSMKEFIDLELKSSSKSRSSNNRKDFKEIAGSFLGKASILSKKLRKWRSKRDSDSSRNRNGDSKCIDNGVGLGLGELRIENLRGRRLSYTQSEVGDYGFGRRSCDTDPRGSIDYGRASIDCGAFGRNSCDSDPRFSIDLGRASVDCGRVSVGELKGEYFEGARRGSAPVVSVIENAMASVYGFDDRVLGERVSGFDRCASVKRDVAVMLEDGEAQALSSAKVSPATVGIFNGPKVVITHKELDDSSESFETASKDLGSVSSSSIGADGADNKKCRQWSKIWNFWGMLHRKKGDKCANNDVKLPQANGKTGSLTRSYSTSSSRGFSGSTSRTESNTIVKRRQDDGVLERNRSTRYSPNHMENGLLRFYLTPSRGRGRSRLGTSRLKKSHSLARSVLM